jgi:hypothetical protein
MGFEFIEFFCFALMVKMQNEICFFLRIDILMM